MTLSREVMNDLLTLYLAGEASTETRRLVEEYARENPTFAKAMAGARTLELPLKPAAPEKELKTLGRVRQFIFLRSLFVGMGIAFTLMPWTCVFRGGRFAFLMIRDEPGLAYAAMSLAAASWTAWWVMNRAVGKAGL
jgi:hypothetical protein